MISQLNIQNFGLIDDLSVEFSTGLNVFTGETGAGKSILIGALNYCLGGKLKSSQVRNAQKNCTVETVLELSDKQLIDSPIFSDYIQDNDPTLIISRTYTPEGRNRNKINGFNITLAQLKKIGDHLVDLHGPHDHQMLLSEESHINILDGLSAMNSEITEYQQKYSEYASVKKELLDLQKLAESRDRENDILAHQIQELEQVSLKDEDYKQLESDIARVNNSERLFECVSRLVNIFDNENSGISSAITSAFSEMRTLNDVDDATSSLNELLENVQENATEISNTLNSYLESLSFSPAEADKINRKYDTYYDILKKYGPSLKDARDFYEEAKTKHGILQDLEHNDSELKKKLAKCEKELTKLAAGVTSKRKTAAKKLKSTIETELKELGIKHVLFECRIEKTDFTETGQDHVVFYISPNAGEDLKPMADIVSSGEAARVMLALKKALTKADPIPVLIFDEIDAQIGGRLGSITGKKLKELSKDRQVILITHLPQIASFADQHFKVLKSVIDSRTRTDVTLLEENTRVEELAAMMAGEDGSEIAEKHAEDMLKEALSYSA